MLKRGDVVFLDSTAIFEAHRTGIWKPLMGGFQLATVEKCLEEAETGNLAGNPNQVDTTELRKKVSVHRNDSIAGGSFGRPIHLDCEPQCARGFCDFIKSRDEYTGFVKSGKGMPE